jgi:hypothetical protein
MTVDSAAIRAFAVRSAALSAVAFLLSGCLAVAATGAVVGTAAAVTGAAVKGTAKGAGMVVGAAIPGDGDDDDRRER